MTMSTSIGQTYFIGLFGAEFRSEFSLSHAVWGSIYAGGTLLSAMLMLLIGGVIDHLSLRKITLIILTGLVVAAFSMAIVPNTLVLIILIFTLRFCGQGMMMNISQVTVARWFMKNRGKAMALVILGAGLSEAFMPPIFSRIISSFSWRIAWIIAGCFIFAIGCLILYLLKFERAPQNEGNNAPSTGLGGRHWTRAEMIKHWSFWPASIGFVAVPFISTIFFFQITYLAEVKAWSIIDLTNRLPVYTLTSFVGLMGMGALCDRFSARALAPFFLIPMAIGLIFLAKIENISALFVVFMFMGFSHGAASAISSLYWPEIYGTKYLGSIRSMTSAIMVFSTSIGPFISGILFDNEIAYTTLLLCLACFCIFCSFTFWFNGRQLISTMHTKTPEPS